MADFDRDAVSPLSGPPDQVVSSDMKDSNDEEHLFADFVESSMLSNPPDQVCSSEETGKAKRPSKRARTKERSSRQVRRKQPLPPPLLSATRIESGAFSNIPPEVIHNILKFLSSEDLISCSIVCKFLCYAASDESLWRRLYSMRWGLASPSSKLRALAWKNLYIQRDREDMSEFVRNTPSELKEYYIQMQAAKRSQAPLPSQVDDHHIILDTTVAEHVSIWRSKRGFTDESVKGHICSGRICTYSQIGDVFLCEKTGRMHVCDDNCRESVWDRSSGLLVCPISGQCFDRWLSPEEDDDIEQLQTDLTDEVEPFIGSGRFAKAYQLGYSCLDDKELEAALRFW